MEKRKIMTIGVHFKCNPDLKERAEAILEKESRTLSEFLRSCMLEKVKSEEKN